MVKISRGLTRWSYYHVVLNRVAEPHHYNADPDPDLSFHFIAALAPDPTFYFNADPDSAPH